MDPSLVTYLLVDTYKLETRVIDDFTDTGVEARVCACGCEGASGVLFDVKTHVQEGHESAFIRGTLPVCPFGEKSCIECDVPKRVPIARLIGSERLL